MLELETMVSTVEVPEWIVLMAEVLAMASKVFGLGVKDWEAQEQVMMV